MLKIIKKYINWLVGDKDSFDAENRLLNSILLLTFLMAFWAEAVNVILGLHMELVVSIGLMSICYGVMYYMLRVKRKYYFVRLTATILTFVFVNLLWYLNSASEGPGLYLFLVFYSFLIFVWEDKHRPYLILIFILNAGGQLIIEYNFPQLFTDYDNPSTRLFDIYASYLMYVLLMAFIMIYAKTNYVSEKERAIKSDKLKSAFLANMSHEIRTPMNAILGFSNLINSNISDEKRDQYKDIIDKNGKYLLQLIDDIIDISKIEADYLEIQKENFKLNDLLNEINELMLAEKDRYKKHEVQLHCINPSMEINFYTDRNRVRQIFLNLVMNAIKFTDEGYIKFGCVKRENEIYFFVKDTGMGISKDLQNKIFERFVKMDNEYNFKYRGTGLGLPICKYMVSKLGGELILESERGKGSNFNFTLPLF